MNKISITFILLGLLTLESQAQINVGVSKAYNTSINTSGVNLNGQFRLNDKFSITPSFSYYLPLLDRTPAGLWRRTQWFEANLNMNYHVINSADFAVYLLAGIGGIVADKGVRDFPIRNRRGSANINPSLNLGAGINLLHGRRIMPFMSLRYNPFIRRDFGSLIGLRVAMFKGRKD